MESTASGCQLGALAYRKIVNMKSEIDLGWGNPYFLLDILDRHILLKTAYHDIGNMNYAPDQGDEKLVNLTKNIIPVVTGLDYKYITITAGATQALNSIMRYEKSLGKNNVLMRKYGYPFYGDMVKNSCLNRLDLNKDIYEMDNSFVILDSPSNPLGEQSNFIHTTVYWDAVYQSSIYNADLTQIPLHQAFVGSYSKLLGLSGARIGWIATNDLLLHQALSDVCLKDVATVSIPSQKLLINVLEQINLEYFLQTGRKTLDSNREIVESISYMFDNQPVPEKGMFYCVHADKKAVETIKKANVKYTEMDDDVIRISLGQTNDVTAQAVDRILKEDSIT